MGGTIVDIGPNGDDPIRVDGRMTPVIMLLDVIHVNRVGHTRQLVNVLCVVEEVWVLANETFVALEM